MRSKPLKGMGSRRKCRVTVWPPQMRPAGLAVLSNGDTPAFRWKWITGEVPFSMSPSPRRWLTAEWARRRWHRRQAQLPAQRTCQDALKWRGVRCQGDLTPFGTGPVPRLRAIWGEAAVSSTLEPSHLGWQGPCPKHSRPSVGSGCYHDANPMACLAANAPQARTRQTDQREAISRPRPAKSPVAVFTQHAFAVDDVSGNTK